MELSKNSEEQQYLNLISFIKENGEHRLDRTSTQSGGSLSIFGHQMRFNLFNSFPLLTTKKVHWKSVVEELLWFIKGDTNANHLSEKGVKIWNSNSTRSYLDSVGLSYDEGDVGPIYGFQWRHFGAEYNGKEVDYTGKGVDQLMGCIKMIKETPMSRRIVMSAWNPCDLKKMALPPCHITCQFFVSTNGKLSCSMYQRSCDVGLGVPFNIASYSLLTCIMAHSCGLECGEFIYFMGDVHIYMNHMEVLNEQIKREPRKFPKLKFLCEPKCITEYTINDFEIIDYNPYSLLKMEMAI